MSDENEVDDKPKKSSNKKQSNKLATDKIVKKSNGLNYTAIIMMLLMLLPAFLTAAMKIWDYFNPEEAYYRQFRTRIQRCYSIANPDKINTIDDVLKKYKGKEHILFAKLKSKYDNIDECQ